MVVPNDILKKQITIKVPKNIMAIGGDKSDGVFVMTLDEYLKYDVKNLENSYVVVDEFHELIKKPDINKFVVTPKGFISFSATIGFTNTTQFDLKFNRPLRLIDERIEIDMKNLHVDMIQPKKKTNVMPNDIADLIEKKSKVVDPAWGSEFIVIVDEKLDLEKIKNAILKKVKGPDGKKPSK